MTLLTFIEQIRTGRTKKFSVYNASSGDYLGTLAWRTGWRRYVMSFETDSDWSSECMDECSEFIKKLMAERKRSL